jgi:hypothetical protein
MPSPFPGMDPYLEAHWGDVHTRIITYSTEQLQMRLPKELRARVEERVYVEAEDAQTRNVFPDVRIYERRRPVRDSKSRSGDESAALAVAEPLVIPIDHEPITERFIEIREAGTGGRIITVIEFLSHSNKYRGKGRKLYLQKQRELRAAGVNSVEVDLLRGGQYTLAVPEAYLPPEYQTPYRVCVWRAAHPLQYEVYRAPLRERLPSIKTPLRQSDEDVCLELQPLIDRAYDTGAYDDIDYSRAPRPRLAKRDAAWAGELLRARGLRPS